MTFYKLVGVCNEEIIFMYCIYFNQYSDFCFRSNRVTRKSKKEYSDGNLTESIILIENAKNY